MEQKKQTNKVSSYKIECRNNTGSLWVLTEICVKLQFINWKWSFSSFFFSCLFQVCARLSIVGGTTYKQTNTINLLLTRLVNNFSPPLLRILWVYLLLCTNLHLTWANNCFLLFFSLKLSNPAIWIKIIRVYVGRALIWKPFKFILPQSLMIYFVIKYWF